jgi:hypothetical protein
MMSIEVRCASRVILLISKGICRGCSAVRILGRKQRVNLRFYNGGRKQAKKQQSKASGRREEKQTKAHIEAHTVDLRKRFESTRYKTVMWCSFVPYLPGRGLWVIMKAQA